MPVALPNLYATAGDVYANLGVDATQLRLDDTLQATGQTVSVTATAGAGLTSLTVSPLAQPLLGGDVLVLAGGGQDDFVEVRLTAPAAAGSTSLSVVALSSAVLAGAMATDNGVNVAFAARLLRGCQYGTAQVKLYCCGRYDDSVLVQSWSVNRWATALASRWVCRRRGNPAPKSIEEEAKESLEEMKAVQSGRLQIEDIGTRTACWPFISNTTVDVRYDLAKVRVESQLSEGTPTIYPQFVDWDSLFLIQGW